ncbi:MAG: hypothetical protein HKN14_13975 [Marinicaulis sp.]|nr:hypothetical protein [Marinicaulis sp.]NNE42014.1 hypothetical protein [Marinicaulis sp.]NNL89059.1 hypothetical protein [Marinicaulis sp.]
MPAATAFKKISAIVSPLFAAIFSAGLSSAAAQTAEVQSSEISAQAQFTAQRPVGGRGRLQRVYWSDASTKELFDMRLEKTARQILRLPDAMRTTKILTARADICSTPGEETIMQIRSPLTCGTLGCQMVVLSEASGSPRVIMRTIGDTLDAPAIDQIVINRGSKRQRSWNYSNQRREFRQMRQR